MAHLGRIGTATSNTGVTTLALTLTAGVPVGATILMAVAWESAAGSVPTITSVIDSSGNTWTTTPDVSVNSGTTVAVAILRARVTTALDAADTVTVTISGGSRSRWAMQADAWDDIDAAPLDEIQSATGSSASLVSGTTAATGQAREVVYCAWGFGSGRTVTPPAGWTADSKVETSAGSGDRALQVIHRYVATVGAQQGTLTLSSSSTYSGVIATHTSTSLEPPEARISQVKLVAPNPGDALLARISQVKLIVPQAVQGEVRISQVRLTAPAKSGQAPYSGIKVRRNGNWWDTTIQTPEGS